MGDEVTVMVELFRAASDGDAGTYSGRAEYTAEGRLRLVDAEPEDAAKLEAAVAAVNRKDRIVELATPEDPVMFSVGSRVTERTDPAFMQALDRYMRRYYGFGLG